MQSCCISTDRSIWQVREQEGVEAAEGVDTLLVHLLSRQHLDRQLEALLSKPNSVVIGMVEAQLIQRQKQHALALLYSSNGRAAEALKIWQVCGTIISVVEICS